MPAAVRIDLHGNFERGVMHTEHNAVENPDPKHAIMVMSQ